MDESKRFYEALGFAKLLDAEDVAIFAIGRSWQVAQRRVGVGHD